MRINRKSLVAPAILIVLLSGCNLPGAASDNTWPASQGKLQAWVDAPLNETRIPLNVPYTVVCHGADPAEVATVEFSVGGSVAQTLTAAEKNHMLLTAKFNWLPSVPGRTVLECRAQNASGTWSEPARAIVLVEDATPTITSTLTVTSTPTATMTFTPTPVPAEITFAPSKSIDLFYYGACEPDRVDISVQLSHTTSVKHVELYLNLLDVNGSGSSGWDSYAVMLDGGNGLFRTTAKSRGLQGADRFASMTVLYQFIVIGIDGSVIARSTTFSDLALNACGSGILPIIPIVPINPPIFPPLGSTLIPPPR